MVHNLVSTNGRPVENPDGVLDQSQRKGTIALAHVQVVHPRQRQSES